ncbi:unannotated protein [freshwater metagenome]|uniref:Unannotated protein n=1 Tax=freshwater metagenome TaxID=449393 RepID=A0A6J7NNU4_9ZZZZ
MHLRKTILARMVRDPRVRRDLQPIRWLLVFVLLIVGLSSVRAVTSAEAASFLPSRICSPQIGSGEPSKLSGGFHAVTPQRLLDTRLSVGRISAGCTAIIDLFGELTNQATGVALTVTTTGADGNGYITVFPCDASQPEASNLNPRPNDDTPNSAIVPLGPSRRICLSTSVGTDLVVDLTGWFGSGGAPFHSQDPDRVLDTRNETLRPDGGIGNLPAESQLIIPIAGTGQVPAGASGVAVNITVVSPAQAGFVTAYPCNVPIPNTSSGNFLAATTRATSGLFALGLNGSLCIYSSQTADIIVDVTGWFGDTTGARLTPIVGTRVVDSRNGTGWSNALAAGETRPFDPTLGGTLAVGSTAVIDVVATGATDSGYLTFFPCGTPMPETSSLNFSIGVDSTNSAIIASGSDGTICVFANVETQVVIDVMGSLGAPGALRSLSVSGHQLNPTFEPDGHDYGIICSATGETWTIQGQGVPGSSVSVVGADPSGTISVVENQLITVTVTLASGATDSYFIRCLPHDFSNLNVTRNDDPTPGWYMISTGFGASDGSGTWTVILDSHGAVVWYHQTSQPVIDFKRLPNGNLAWVNILGATFGTNPTGAYEEHAVNGSLVRTWSTIDTTTDHHDMKMLANGNVMMLSYHQRTGIDVSALGADFTNSETVFDAWIQEITPVGAVVWEWHSEDHIGISETTAQLDGVNIRVAVSGAVDLVHINSVDVDPTTGDLIVSMRHTDATYRIRRSPALAGDGSIIWKLSGNAPTEVGAQHLTLVGDPYGGTRRQHDARILPNGNITIFDDESGRTAETARAVEYAINNNAGTATMVREWRSQSGPSAAMGGTRRQSDGSIVICWGSSPPLFTEIDPFGSILLNVEQLPTGAGYRIVKEPLTSFNAATLRAAVS